MHITEILLADGYETYKFISKTNWNKDAKRHAQIILDNNKENVVFKKGDINSDESDFYLPCSFNSIYLSANYNCMQNGGTATFFVKNKDFENAFIFGLSEYGKPPTLIKPRPKIKFNHLGYDCDEKIDDAMNFCLKSEKHIDILNAIKNGIEFNYLNK